MPYRKIAYLASRYGPLAYRAGRMFARNYRKRYAKRGGRPYLRGGKSRMIKTRAKYQKFSTSRVGEAIGTSESKSVTTHDVTLSGRNTRVLYDVRLTTVTKGDNRNQRERNIINVGGFKITFAVRNDRTVPGHFHLAVLSPKDSTSLVTSDFFRSPSDTRAVDFGLPLGDLSMDNLPINSDKYQILRHKRYTLMPSANNANWQSNSGNNFTTIRWYVKLKRQLRYEENTDTIPQSGEVFLVWWISHMGDNTGDAVTTDGYEIGYRTEMYFREPRSG